MRRLAERQINPLAAAFQGTVFGLGKRLGIEGGSTIRRPNHRRVTVDDLAKGRSRGLGYSRKSGFPGSMAVVNILGRFINQKVAKRLPGGIGQAGGRDRCQDALYRPPSGP